MRGLQLATPILLAQKGRTLMAQKKRLCFDGCVAVRQKKRPYLCNSMAVCTASKMKSGKLLRLSVSP